MRSAIAATMSRSKREIPHYYLSHSINLSPALEALQTVNQNLALTERILPTVLLLKAVARDKRQRFETAEELLLALERGATRSLTAPAATPLMLRDPTAVWKIALSISALFNLLLVYWLLFLPK